MSTQTHKVLGVGNHQPASEFLRLNAQAGSGIELSASGSSDPDDDALAYEWLVYAEAGTYRGQVALSSTNGLKTRLTAPGAAKPEIIHVILKLKNDDHPALCSYRRVIMTLVP